MKQTVCVGCDDEILEDHSDFNGQPWHESCFEVSGSSTYCCGREYDEGQDSCNRCGEPL